MPTTEELISSDTSLTNPTAVMNGNGDLAVVWTGFGHVLVRYRPAGGAWEAVSRLEINASSTGIVGTVQAAMNELGDVVVGWVALSADASQYEVHAVYRPKAGPWPATGGFQVAGSPASLFDSLTVAIDDSGRSAAAWTAAYASVDDSGNSRPATVLRAAVRPAGGPWGVSYDLSERGPEGVITCEAGHPALPSAGRPRFSSDPATGELALAYVFDASAWDYSEAAGSPGCYNSLTGTDGDVQLRLGFGTVAAPPTTFAAYGGNATEVGHPSWNERGAAVSVGGHRVSAAWREVGAGNTTLFHFGQAILGGSLVVSLSDTADPITTDVATGGDGVGFVVASRETPPNRSALAWQVASGVADSPQTLPAPGTLDASIAANCLGDAVVASGGSDLKVYISEHPGTRASCTVIFADGFESGGSTAWQSGGG